MVFRRRAAVAAMLAGFLAAPAVAHAAPARLRGVITGLSGDVLTVTSAAGDADKVELAARTGVTWVVPSSLDAITKGSFIGTAALPGPKGALMAIEVHIFPESMRGTGEGYRPFDLKPQSTMTNGTVGSVTVANGRTLTVTYKGGQQTVIVPPRTPVVAFAPATRAALTVGAHVIAFVSKEADSKLVAIRLLVGKNGLVPPM